MLQYNAARSVRKFTFLQNGRVSVNRVAVKNGARVAYLRILQRFKGVPAGIRLAQPNNQANYNRPFHQPLAMLCSRCKTIVDMQRMLIHAQQTEQRVVKLGDGSARPVPERLARFQFFEIAAVCRDGQMTTITRAMRG